MHTDRRVDYARAHPRIPSPVGVPLEALAAAIEFAKAGQEPREASPSSVVFDDGGARWRN